ADDVEETEGEVRGIELPDPLVGELLGRPAPAGPERVPGRESLEAVAVERADTVERVTRPIVRDPHVPELRMEQAVHRLPVDHPAPTDAGADRDVAEGLEAGRGTPAMLAECGGVDVRVEGERDVERLSERGDE